jgi:hypothetical protein
LGWVVDKPALIERFVPAETEWYSCDRLMEDRGIMFLAAPEGRPSLAQGETLGREESCRERPAPKGRQSRRVRGRLSPFQGLPDGSPIETQGFTLG